MKRSKLKKLKGSGRTLCYQEQTKSRIGSNILFYLIIIFLSLTGMANAQSEVISGTVTDASGEAIVGANIIIKGTLTGTVSDVNGNFSIDVPPDATLVVSFVGYLDKEVEIGNQKQINVQLEQDLIGLEEIVVVGYGNMKKADLTGSVSVINNEHLVKTAAPNITSTLTGKLTGVITRQTSGKPGADSPSFLIRGKSTFDPNNRGTNNPLILIDGVVRDFDRIDPNDIESITVLKDAASASIYGVRGANGVILVTTKRGSNTAPKITFSSSYTSQKATFRPEYMNAGQYAPYINAAQVNSEEDSLYTAEEVQQFQDGTLQGTDWWGEMMRNSTPIFQNSLSVNGGNDRTVYYLSLGNINQRGLYETASYKRYNVRSNIDTKVTDNLSVNVDISARKDYTSGSTIGEYKLHQTLETAIPTIPAYVPEELRIPGDELGLNYNGTAGSPMGEAIHSGYNKTENSFLESNIGLKYKIPFIEGLSAKINYAYDIRFTENKQFSKPYTLNYYTRDAGLINTVESQSLTSLQQKTEKRTRKTFQGGLNYARTFGNHSVTALFLFEQMDYRYEFMQAYREGYLAQNIDQIFAGSDVNKDNDGSASEDARRGYIGRITYNYKEKYLFQANARYDGSYNFPENKRWGFFPGFSAGWRISEESFMENLSFLDNLKFRISWGQSGNENTEPFYYLPGYEYRLGYIVGNTYYSGIRDTGIPNEDITWETATTSNYGFEFGIFRGKVSGEFDYFTKRTEGILITRSESVPMYVGSDLPKENLGKVDNYGIESILRFRDQKGKLRYEIEGNLTYATSKVIYIDEPADVSDELRETGRPFDSRYGYTAIGLFQTQEEIDNAPVQDNNGNQSIRPGDIRYLDLNGDSIIDGDDRHFIGKGSTPELIFGINLNVQYRNFALNVNFQGASNYTRYQYLGSFEKKYNTYSVLEDSWRVGNEDAEYPRLEADGRSENNSKYSTYWLHDGFYIKLRNIELSYTFTNIPIMDKIGLDELTVYAAGRNLWTIAKKDGFDPEGTDNRYPIMQTMSVGVNLVF